MYFTDFYTFKNTWKHEKSVLLNSSREVVAIINIIDNLQVAIIEEMAYSEDFPFKFISFNTETEYNCTIEVELCDEEDVWTETFYLDYAVEY